MALHMPHRSVTRFFVPLIDVLILLFCIFLLLDYNSETNYEKQSIDVENQSAQARITEDALTSRTKEIQRLEKKLEDLREQNPEAAGLIDEIERLRKELDKLKSLRPQDRITFRIIDIDAKDGTISYYDGKKAEPLPDAAAARALIARHKKQAAGKELYYHFLYPRPRKVFPLVGQEEDYAEWFMGKGVANSLPPRLEKKK